MIPCELIENQLCDIQLPEPVPFWPPAPGYWIIAIFLIILLYRAGLWLYRYYSRSIKSLALKELRLLRQHYSYPNNMTILTSRFFLGFLRQPNGYRPIKQNNGEHDQLLLIALSQLLRRVALARFPRQQVAGLTGIAWLQFLDQTGMTKEFTEGEGQVLYTGPYQKSPPVYNAEKLFHLVEAWIKQQ